MSTGSKWRDDPRGPYIRMHSGEKVFLNDPTPDQIRVPDAAYHLARINRYTGASEFSDAQHMVVGAQMAARFYPDAKLLPARFMIHDVGEHLLNDISSPLKHLLPEYRALQDRWDLCVERRFDMTFLGDPLVKELDARMWITERLYVYRDCLAAGVDISEDYGGPLQPFELGDQEFYELFSPWSSEWAEDAWLTELRERLPWVR